MGILMADPQTGWNDWILASTSYITITLAHCTKWRVLFLSFKHHDDHDAMPGNRRGFSGHNPARKLIWKFWCGTYPNWGAVWTVHVHQPVSLLTAATKKEVSFVEEDGLNKMKLRGFKNSCSDEFKDWQTFMEKENWYNLQDLAVLFLHIDNFSFRNISVQGFYVSRCHCERSLKRKMHGTGDSVQTSFVHDVPVSLKGFLASNKNTHRFSWTLR